MRTPHRQDFEAGWYGVPGGRSGGVVHCRRRGEREPICGVRVGAGTEFQFCASGTKRAYVECRTCLRMLDLQERPA